ncbi:GDSL esterase/lipase [Trichophyton mentagrophytes]|uniref:SGNH hydrolase-type esterase domain-containing protein n=1 Tax=Trichophyton interdigitale (strain MR816) TaxID=1215338 RepID=A0A059JEM7_TRIIM|nr:hypothetical protein H101_00053 [Trichophyton interdigitale H6]KDB26310.1 hypothetical protein H109_01884 [Trichophyton interdigitale MR816]GBF63728.1 GDSL esterase/lipase [Trichophyton mentagrophytes]
MSYRYFRRDSRLDKVTPNDYPRIYLFGDSLTERGFFPQDVGFGWQLQKYYADRVEVVNEGEQVTLGMFLSVRFPLGGNSTSMGLIWIRQTSRSLRRQFNEYLMGAIKSRGPPAPLFITIFLGANDACLSLSGAMVPLEEYEEHIRHYLNTILDDPATQETKVILISPPPVNVPVPVGEPLLDNPDAAIILRSVASQSRGHRTWESKRTYAKKIVEIGKEYEAQTSRVAVLDLWYSLTKSVCRIEGTTQDDAFYHLDIDEMLPGSGMPGAKPFDKGYFTDGLHFGDKAYEILGRELLDLALTKWPELKRENFPRRVRLCQLPDAGRKHS